MRGELVVGGDMPLPDSGTLNDPVVRGLNSCRQLGIGQHKLFGQFDRLGADFLGHAAKCGFHRHARFHADEHQVERIGPGLRDRLLALGGAVGDVEDGRIEAAIGDEDADEGLDEQRLVRHPAEQE